MVRDGRTDRRTDGRTDGKSDIKSWVPHLIILKLSYRGHDLKRSGICSCE